MYRNRYFYGIDFKLVIFQKNFLKKFERQKIYITFVS